MDRADCPSWGRRFRAARGGTLTGMMLNTGNRNQVVLLGTSGNRSVRSLRAHRTEFAGIGTRPQLSISLRALLHRSV